jgi:four helix bundle protein
MGERWGEEREEGRGNREGRREGRREKGERRREKGELGAMEVRMARGGFALRYKPQSRCEMRDHKNLECWREARAVNLDVLRVCRDCWKPSAAALFAQLQRAALSVQLNIAEGYTFGNSKTFTHHLSIAFGSAVETVDLIELAMDSGAIEADDGARLLEHARGARRRLVGLLKQRRTFQ